LYAYAALWPLLRHWEQAAYVDYADSGQACRDQGDGCQDRLMVAA
jgi:hypothetical protein